MGGNVWSLELLISSRTYSVVASLLVGVWRNSTCMLKCAVVTEVSRISDSTPLILQLHGMGSNLTSRGDVNQNKSIRKSCQVSAYIRSSAL